MPHYHDPVAATLIRVLSALPGYIGWVTLRHRWPAMVSAVCDRRAMIAITLVAILGPFLGTALSMLALEALAGGSCHHDYRHDARADLAAERLPLPRNDQLSRCRGAILAVAGVALLML